MGTLQGSNTSPYPTAPKAVPPVLSHARDIIEEWRPQVCEDILSELKSAARARFRKLCTCTMATHPPQAYQMQPLTAVAVRPIGAPPALFPPASQVHNQSLQICTHPGPSHYTPSRSGLFSRSEPTSSNEFWQRVNNLYIAASLAITLVLTFIMYKFAKWTAQKDFYELCLEIKSANQPLSNDCNAVLGQAFPRPPGIRRQADASFDPYEPSGWQALRDVPTSGIRNGLDVTTPSVVRSAEVVLFLVGSLFIVRKVFLFMNFRRISLSGHIISEMDCTTGLKELFLEEPFSVGAWEKEREKFFGTGAWTTRKEKIQ